MKLLKNIPFFIIGLSLITVKQWKIIIIKMKFKKQVCYYKILYFDLFYKFHKDWLLINLPIALIIDYKCRCLKLINIY